MITWLFKIIFVTGIILMVIGYFESERMVRPPRIVEYRYIPRTIVEEDKEPVELADIYKDMFDTTILGSR